MERLYQLIVYRMGNRMTGGQKIIIRQNTKGLFNAEFDILLKNGEKGGNINMQGILGSREGRFQIAYEDRQVTLFPAKRREIIEYADSIIKNAPFRPYKVLENNSVGMMFHDQIKTGFFKSAGYHFLQFAGMGYYLYYVGFGEKGICAPVYKGNMQVAEIRKECTVIDDLHIFHIHLQQTVDLLAAIILCCYMYVITYYRAGERSKKGVQKKIVLTKNEYLLSKCSTIL